MKNNKEELTNQLKIFKTEYEKLCFENKQHYLKFTREESLRYKAITSLDNKIEKIQSKLYDLETAKLESKHPKAVIESAKAVLEECGYSVIRI
jgi:phage shock protein A